MPTDLTSRLTPGDHHIAIVLGRFNEFIGEELLRGALNTWEMLGGQESHLHVARVPGSFEMPVVAKKLAETKKYAAIVCLGCVIRGETSHYDHVVEEATRGIMDVNTQTGVPCVFGVLTCETLEQAIHRAGGKVGHQGRYSMMTAVEMANLLEAISP